MIRKDQKKGRIYLIPTPLSEGTGKLMTTNRTLEIIKHLQHYVVENRKSAIRFLKSICPELKIEEIHFDIIGKKQIVDSYDELMSPVNKGQDMGIMSEAGAPCIADPGAKMVEYAHWNDIKVIPLPGPSSIILALMASGFNGQKFAFHGYLPIDRQERLRAIKKIERESANSKAAQIFIETPHRNERLFSELLRTCQSSTELCLAMDITGDEEYIKSLTVAKWKKSKPTFYKIPAIFLMQA